MAGVKYIAYYVETIAIIVILRLDTKCTIIVCC